jgi:hypothetical protein
VQPSFGDAREEKEEEMRWGRSLNVRYIVESRR